MALFEGYERRIDKINEVLRSYGIQSVEEAKKIVDDLGVDVYEIVKGIQPICFENACWAYIVGAAIAVSKGNKTAYDVAKSIGEGLQAFCIPGSVADDRKVGLGHGNLAAMLLSEETKCFAFLAGHESFAAAEGAIGIARNANKARKEPLRVILNGLGKSFLTLLINIIGLSIRLFSIYIVIPESGIQGYLWGLLISQLVVSIIFLFCLRLTTAKPFLKNTTKIFSEKHAAKTDLHKFP